MNTTNTLNWIRLPEPSDAPRTIHLNTSANGGGVAEILTAITTHADSNGIASGWGVLGATTSYYDFTKNLHHLMHGHGDPKRLDLPVEADIYRRTLTDVLPGLISVLTPTDTVILHDPQTLGLACGLREHVAGLYWHCHVGSTTDPRKVKEAIWSYFREDTAVLDGVLVVDPAYVSGISARTIIETYPAIWSRSPKNMPLSHSETQMHLREIGLFGPGSARTIAGRLWQTDPLPADAVAVLQVSRWDPLKGMSSVLQTLQRLDETVHLILAGPDPDEVLDDPEGSEQLTQTLQVWESLPQGAKHRAHVIALSADDLGNNARRVNALQRRADIVTQRSIEEGFGLTVTEAMLKGKPVVASRTGGLIKQIDHDQNGILVEPLNDDEFVAAVNTLARDASLRTRLGQKATFAAARHFSLERLVKSYSTLATPTKQRT